jgi:hypothetical protein
MKTPDRVTLDAAVFAFYEAKQAEERARNTRLECENRIIELIGVKEEGTQSVKTDLYKISTSVTLTRTLVEHYGAALDALDAETFNAIIKHKPVLDVTAFKKLAIANPEAYRIACGAVVSKPGKLAIKLDIIEQKQEAA